jgi:hypothetical protein
MNIPKYVIEWCTTLDTPDHSRAEHNDKTHNQNNAVWPVFSAPGHAPDVDLAQIADAQNQSKNGNDQKPGVKHLL